MTCDRRVSTLSRCGSSTARKAPASWTGREPSTGSSPRSVRTLQNLGYDQSILAVYDGGLRSGEALMTVPCPAERRYDIGNALRARGGHGIIYFGAGTAETLSAP